MLLRIVAIALLMALVGCVATSQEMYLSDGSKGHNIGCEGSVTSTSDCFQKAGEVCGSKGYDIVNRDGEGIPAAMVAAAMVVTRSLFIKCKQ